jgi:hypothetical protein
LVIVYRFAQRVVFQFPSCRILGIISDASTLSANAGTPPERGQNVRGAVGAGSTTFDKISYRLARSRCCRSPSGRCLAQAVGRLAGDAGGAAAGTGGDPTGDAEAIRRNSMNPIGGAGGRGPGIAAPCAEAGARG